MNFYSKMNNYSIATLALVLLMSVAALGAPSNSSSTTFGGHNKKPEAPVSGSGHVATGRSAGNSSSHGSSIKGASTTSTTPTKAPKSVLDSHKKVNSTSSRVTRDLEGEEFEQGISEGRSDILKTTAQHKNSTRVVRNAAEEDDQAAEGLNNKAASNSTQHFVPSTHPLFANRQTSNITHSLKPKLRTPGSGPVIPAGGSSDSEEEDKHAEHSGSHAPSSKAHQKESVSSSTSSEESVSVVSSGHVAVKGKDSARPVGTGSRRAGSSSTHAPIEEDDMTIFIV